MSINEKIQNIIQENKVVLFMKGTSTMPQCGFSSKVSSILNFINVSYHDINVLEDEEIRQGIKDFSDWPTIPQLYIDKEFIGGCDIIIEMTLSGELDKVLKENNIPFNSEASEKIRKENS